MSDLIRFELQKMVARRVTQVAVLGLFALLIVIFALNILQQSYIDNEGQPVSGLAAIAQMKQNGKANAGTITEERAINDIRAYQRFFTDDGEIDPFYHDPDKGGPEFTAYENERYAYLSLILAPWMDGSEPIKNVAPRIDATDGLDLYAASAAALQTKLDEGMDGTWSYSDAERSYWTARYDTVTTPIDYGYADGWGDILACVDFLFFAIVAVCIAVTPLFASEYQEKTDSVILSTRYGKSKLVTAKIAAAFIFATIVFAAYAAVAVGIPLMFFGAEGADLPLQIADLTLPYPLTMAQAVGICIGIAYALTLGMTALTLLLSAKLRSILSIFAIGMAIVLIPAFIPQTPFGLVNHILYLFPLNALNYFNQFAKLVSYPIGSVVFDLQVVTVIVQFLTIAICVPLAARTFRRHQVS